MLDRIVDRISQSELSLCNRVSYAGCQHNVAARPTYGPGDYISPDVLGP